MTQTKAILCLAAFTCSVPNALAQTRPVVDLLVTHGVAVTMDAQRRVINDAAIAITGDTITAIDTNDVLLARYQAAKTVDAHGGILLPGLINAHTHVPMSMFRGLAEDMALQDWLKKYIFPAEASNVNAEFVTWATRLSLLEMVRGGTTTIADMYYFEDEIAKALKEAGVRGILGETIIGFPAPDNKTSTAALAYGERYLTHWRNDPLITAAIAPHSLYTCSEQLLKDSVSLARAYHAPILIHLAEAPSELEISRREHGLSPVQYLAKIGVLGPDVLGAHCIEINRADIATLAHLGVGCSHNPSSNMKGASGVSPVPEMLAAGVPVGLGSDGPASNNNQDIFEEMDMAGKLQKLARMDPAALPAEQIVAMATITGARALHMEKQIGSLEAGKKADIAVIDTANPHATPMYNVYAQLVYALKSSDVRTTIIAGKIIMDDGNFTTLDEPAILAKAAAMKQKVAASFPHLQ